MKITQLKQGNLEGLHRQVRECIDNAYRKGYEDGYEEGSKTLEEFEDLFIFENDYKEFLKEYDNEKYKNYTVFDLVAQYGISRLIMDFKKWQKEQGEIKVGDVVRHEYESETEIVTRDNVNNDPKKMHIMYSDGSTDTVDKTEYVKTGKNVADKLMDLLGESDNE